MGILFAMTDIPLSNQSSEELGNEKTQVQAGNLSVLQKEIEEHAGDLRLSYESCLVHAIFRDNSISPYKVSILREF